jgi:hypothetical protein
MREKVRDWDGARGDLELLVQLQQRASTVRNDFAGHELHISIMRLQTVVRSMRERIPLDPYLLL